MTKPDFSDLCNCSACSLKDLPKIPWQYPTSPDWPILIIGQAPGSTEAVTKIPFTGKAGKMAFRLLAEAGLRKTYLPITNTVICPPPKDRAPKISEQACCLPRLKAEILHVKPKLIIAFGKEAATILTGKGGKVFGLRGQFYPLLPSFNHDCQVLITFHPSFVQRQRQWINLCIEDLKMALPSITQEITINETFPQPPFILDPTPGQFADWANSIKANDTLTLDIETTGLDARTDQLLGIAFCLHPQEALALSLNPGDPRWETMVRLCEDPQIAKNVQNGSFDYNFLVPLDCRINNIRHDTRLAETLIHPDMPKDLQAMRAYYTNIPAYKPSRSEMKKIVHWPKDKTLTMGCWDVITTEVVRRQQLPMMSEKEKFLQQDLLIPLIEVFEHMERKGMKVHINLLAGLYAQQLPKIQELQTKFINTYGILPSSPKQIKEKFSYLPDTNKETLKYYINRGHPDAPILLELLTYRKASKIASVYLKGVYERLYEGYVHPTRKIEGTGTGRPSTSNPNLANVPEELRVIYIPDSPDFLFLEMDKSQLELRVGGLLAPAQTLLDELASGVDPHEEMRLAMFGGQEEGRQRLIAKTVVFGTFYGRSARSIAIAFGVSEMEAIRWQRMCIEKHPGFGLYRKRCMEAFQDNESIETPFGRRRIIQSITQGFNTPVQSTAADIALYDLLELYRAGADLRNTVYDSFLIQLPKATARDEAIYYRSILERPIDRFGGYIFPCTAKIGSSWGTLEKLA